MDANRPKRLTVIYTEIADDLQTLPCGRPGSERGLLIAPFGAG